VSREPIKKGDLVCLNPEKYDFSKSWGTGIVLKTERKEDWEITTVFWTSDAQEDSHHPEDLKVVQ